MKSSLALISAGVLLLVFSIGAWLVMRPAPTAGDPTAFEQALTVAAPTPLSPEGAGRSLAAPAGPPAPVSGLRFTVGQSDTADGPAPVRLRIPALDEQADIVPVGVDPSGDMEVPDSVREVGWYRYGAAPGEPGSAVLAAHVDLAGQGPGVFFRLRDLDPGSLIFVDFEDGSTGAYVAEARATYQKDELPTAALFSRDGPAVLTLITCGGDFNRSIRRYDSNVVVFAVPAETASLPFS